MACAGLTAADHPRIRGEHTSGRRSGYGTTGSSPHTRGARTDHTPYRRRNGIIPAYAGSTPVRSSAHTPPSDHPRIRGEHPGNTNRSPRLCRIIPAYAGSTPTHWWPPPERSDHPRIRGEHSPLDDGKLSTRGSSPHTRGAPASGRRASPGRGIIPAYAGSTSRRCCLAAGGRDHPRIRGEHAVDVGPGWRRRGSSPHTRGAQRRLLPPHDARRIIPAYAGSTVTTRGRIRSPADHPRIRGEHPVLVEGHLYVPGSSPHTRGALRPEPIFRRKDGGSSPHTRGARAYRGAAVPANGIIPAYAGSTSPTARRPI